MKKSELIKIIGSLALIAAAVVLYLKLRPTRESQNGSAYFYDLQEKKLFVAPQGSIPPINGINGINGAAGEGVRAIIVSPSGDASDKKNFQIAYLEEYTPEVKELFEEVHKARLEGRSEEGRINRKEVAANTLVRRIGDSDWQPINSPQGKIIANEWNNPGPDGKMPVVCSP
ncbi:MAG TPA: hypothetical protein VGO67_00070 [Verrucomicrobiae bacterium]